MQKFSSSSLRARAGIVWLLPRSLWGIAAVLLFAVPAHGDPPESPSPTPAATPARKPTPTPTPLTEHRAPAGVLYLLEDTLVPLPHGLQGVVAGTEVRLVKVDGDMVQVAIDDIQFTIKKTRVTDDLDMAAAAKKRAAAVESTDEAIRQEQEAVLVKQQQEQIEFLRTHPLATPTPTPAK